LFTADRALGRILSSCTLPEPLDIWGRKFAQTNRALHWIEYLCHFLGRCDGEVYVNAFMQPLPYIKFRSTFPRMKNVTLPKSCEPRCTPRCPLRRRDTLSARVCVGVPYENTCGHLLRSLTPLRTRVQQRVHQRRTAQAHLCIAELLPSCLVCERAGPFEAFDYSSASNRPVPSCTQRTKFPSLALVSYSQFRNFRPAL
jgi:hypothetical protein